MQSTICIILDPTLVWRLPSTTDNLMTFIMHLEISVPALKKLESMVRNFKVSSLADVAETLRTRSGS